MLDYKNFQNPSNQFRGRPFWSWNGKLQKDELLRQIDCFKKMGMGGFFCHSRTGLATRYLGDEWFSFINACADKGEKHGLQTWIYDEDRWPSGSAGGMATSKPGNRMKFIRINQVPSTEFIYSSDIIAAFEVDIEGYAFFNKRRLARNEKPVRETVLFFTIEEMDKSSFYNGNTYIDTMSHEAVAEFIQLTHEQYRKNCGTRSGKSIHGIFTDEPHRGPVMCGFSIGNENAQNLTPFTPGLFDAFRQKFGYDLVENLPELFLQANGEKIHPVKWQYMELTEELFLKNYMGQIQEWCEKYGLKTTGHLLHEDSLTAQSCMIGSIMRGYEYMDVPGVDVLAQNNRNFFIVKQLQSAARQLGKTELLSEMYGATGWHMDFQSHKQIGDWQALFGINVRCHHLSWYTMQGEAKRDYPASIFFQSAWYKEYKAVEDYFARIHLFMSQGQPECKLLVLNPVESLWSMIHAGWSWQLGVADEDVRKLETIYSETFKTICEAKIDFDYGDEEMLGRLYNIQIKDSVAILSLGKAQYTTLLIAGALTIRRSTLNIAKDFIQAGGRVVVAGDIPACVDAVKTEEVRELKAFHSSLEPADLIDSLNIQAAVSITDGAGKNIPDIYAQIRKDNDQFYCMLLNTNIEKEFKNVSIKWNENGVLEQWDARTGQVEILDKDNATFGESHLLDTMDPTLCTESSTVNAYTHTESNAMNSDLYIKSDTNNSYSHTEKAFCLKTNFAPSEEKLFILNKKVECSCVPKETTSMESLPLKDSNENAEKINVISNGDSFEYKLTEPNVCVLDRVGYKIDNKDWSFSTDILKADQQIRKHYGLPVRSGEMIQPWFTAQTQSTKLGNIELAYEFSVDKIPDNICLAIETPENFEIYLNGYHIDTKEEQDFWVDPCFIKIPILSKMLKPGKNQILLKTNFSQEIQLEAIYLLGNFAVETDGLDCVLTDLTAKLYAGDITKQGFPFYGAGIRYFIPISFDLVKNQHLFIEFPDIHAACVKIIGTDKEKIIAFKPYKEDITEFANEKNLQIEYIFTRRNTFGPLHIYPVSDKNGYVSPDSFLTSGEGWIKDGYSLVQQGMVDFPIFWING